MGKTFIQCSNCGMHTEIGNTVKDSVKLLERGWNSIGSALYCPDCTRKIQAGPQAGRLAGKMNTFSCLVDKILKSEERRRDA